VIAGRCCTRVIAIAFLVSSASAETIQLQARGTMFRAEVVLNERVVAHALIDTGAAYVSLCAPTASSLGLALGSSVVLVTANGTIQGRFAAVATIRIGPIVLRSVTAVVKMDDTPCGEGVLVGMSALHKLESMRLKNGTLTLTGPATTQPPAQPPRPKSGWWSWK
jgi:clan AA aspartic protease (TIGR02281 family)